MSNKKKDTSPTWMHEEMLNNPTAENIAKIDAFKHYVKSGKSKEKAMQMAGIRTKK